MLNHKCCTNGTCNVFLWQSSRKRQIICIKKVKPVLLKKKVTINLFVIYSIIYYLDGIHF